MLQVKRFLKDKNTVTVLGVVLVAVILFVGYMIQVNRATSPVSVPVASQTIQPRTKITSDMIEHVDVASIMLRGDVIRNEGEIVGKYSNYNTLIPEGSMFYSSSVSNEADLPDAALLNLGKDEIPYSFPVNLESTYGNSIMPESYIDIYMKAENDQKTIMVGKLLKNVKVLAVKDSSGNSVFENTETDRQPAFLIFGLKYDVWLLLKKASYLTENSIELFPVPKGVEIEVSGNENAVSSETLSSFIESKTVPNSEVDAEMEAQEAKEEAETTTKENTNTTNSTTKGGQ